uniref:Uncharacterized protein n=1 Tax=Anguilla anguilla TaxID=7936 RepID=A0A0E9U1E3_ANGAN
MRHWMLGVHILFGPCSVCQSLEIWVLYLLNLGQSIMYCIMTRN